MGLTVFVEMGVGLAELPPGGNRATGALGAPSMGAREAGARGPYRHARRVHAGLD